MEGVQIKNYLYKLENFASTAEVVTVVGSSLKQSAGLFPVPGGAGSLTWAVRLVVW